MAHIVCITGGLTGIFNASISLVKQLEKAGHRVTYASPKDWSDLTNQYNIPFVQLDSWIFEWKEQPLSRWQKFRQLGERRNQAIKALGVENFAETMKELNPDLLLIDMEMHPHIMTAVVNDLPVALLCQFLSIWKRGNLPPIHTDIIPGEGWRGKWFGIEWTWLRYGWTKWREYQHERWQKMGVDQISVLRCYAKKIGYPFQERFGFKQSLVPYPHKGLPILCFNGLELDFYHDPPSSMYYIGPMVWENRQESKIEQNTYQTLERIFEKRRLTGNSLIYCGCSSFNRINTKFLRQIIDAVSSCPQWDLVVGLGSQLDFDKLGSLPSNVYVLSWAPQTQILKHADCAIINAGINTINECIYFGVPMLVYSLKRYDQNGNAARIAYHQLGIVGDMKQDNVSEIRNYIQTLLTEKSYQTQVNRMRNCFHRYTNENLAAKVVEALLHK
ncbi:nucleotide disphospho-sugar-binding domain-containing protein [Dapis sp. BLCC M126]|uniref:nucleotide disphospho-sugar-binding domain-containing protein n=1 Tax=Dapis sp. BLCC M126 TaxID=3400189 RepID=UPI003CF350FB